MSAASGVPSRGQALVRNAAAPAWFLPKDRYGPYALLSQAPKAAIIENGLRVRPWLNVLACCTTGNHRVKRCIHEDCE